MSGPMPGRRMVARSLTYFLTLAALAAAPAAAQMSSSSSCGTENLLAGKVPVASGVRGSMYLVTDGQVGPEGATWDAPVTVQFDLQSGSLTWDLGRLTPVSAFAFQGDANDLYKVFGSPDGAPGSFKVLAEIENVVTVGHGLRTRPATIAPTMVRFLRLGEPEGDAFYSVSEFQAFCQAPSPFPPHLKIIDAPAAKVAPSSFWTWDNDMSSRVELMIAFYGLCVLGWGVWLARKGTPDKFKKLRDRLLMLLGVLSFCAYWNFFSFHFGNYFHAWDAYHYYVGSKYFKELSYDRLYECDAVADSEDPSLRRRVELRKIMDLRTNMMTTTAHILAHPEECKKHFTPERWEAFKRDLSYWRRVNGVKRWEDSQADHGYNATPVWNILGSALANTGPATDNQVWWLIRIDPLFIVGLSLMTWWAFGWRVLSVALAVFATSFPNRFYWTGGAFLRWDWLFYFVGSACLVKKEKPLLGGIFLGYSALLRVFPAFCIIGPALVIVQQMLGEPSPERPWWKPKPFAGVGELVGRIDRRYLRFFAGIALISAIMLPISLVTSNGIASYVDFYKNSQKHNKTPLTNYMGLKTVLIYRPSEVGRHLQDTKLQDPWGRWKEIKLKTGEKTKPLLRIAQLAFIVLLWRALRGRGLRPIGDATGPPPGVEPWAALAMGTTFMAVLFELTCYYYSFMFVVALLYEKKRDAGALLLAATAFTGFLDWAPTKYLPNTPPWDHLKISTWLDEQYTWMSLGIVVAFVWTLYKFAYPEPLPEGAVAEGPSPDAAGGDDDEVGSRAAQKRGPKRSGVGKGGARRRR
jgi:hypothetical protein